MNLLEYVINMLHKYLRMKCIQGFNANKIFDGLFYKYISFLRLSFLATRKIWNKKKKK